MVRRYRPEEKKRTFRVTYWLGVVVIAALWVLAFKSYFDRYEYLHPEITWAIPGIDTQIIRVKGLLLWKENVLLSPASGALSYPLGGKYHVPHGESNYAVFTGVMKNYIEIKEDGEIAEMMGFISSLLCCRKDDAWEALEDLLNKILPKKSLHEYGVEEEELEEFTDSVMQRQQRLMSNNFVPLDRDRVLKIYMELY